MGATNAMMVFTYWRHLAHRERALLAYLALVARDTDSPPVYFGGWEAAAAAIGSDPNDEPKNAAEVFRRSMAALRKAGAVVPNGTARQGSRAEYALTLDPALTVTPTVTRNGTGRPVTAWTVVHRQVPRSPSSPTATVPLSPTATVPHQPHRQGGMSPTATVPPTTTEEPLQEYSEEELVESQPQSPAAVDNSNDGSMDGISTETYAAASEFLQARPAQHVALMAQAAEQLGPDCGTRRQVITAATLAGWRPKEAAA